MVLIFTFRDLSPWGCAYGDLGMWLFSDMELGYVWTKRVDRLSDRGDDSSNSARCSFFQVQEVFGPNSTPGPWGCELICGSYPAQPGLYRNGADASSNGTLP